MPCVIHGQYCNCTPLPLRPFGTPGSESLFSNKSSNFYRDGVLSQFKKDPGGFKIVDHLDKGSNPLNAHIEHLFDKKGNFKGSGF